jgi:hypothetical protein
MQVLISELILENFKGIKQGKIPLAPLTFLAGSNNAGKTTILEALFLAPNPLRQVPYGDSAVSVVRKIHQTLDSGGYAFLMRDYREKKAVITCLKDSEDYSLELSSCGDVLYLFSNKNLPEFPKYKIDGKAIKAFGWLGLSLDMKETGDASLFMGDSLLISSSLIESGYLYLRNNWANVMNSGIARKIVQEVSELSHEKYSDLTLEPFLGNTFALYAFKTDGKRVRLGDLGEGIQTYILARMLYEMQQPELLLWDDIEAHLNPRILVKLSEWFSQLIEEGKQVVITTHSLEAIKLISPETDDQDPNKPKPAIVLTSLAEGLLETKTISLQELEEYKQAGIDIRMAESFLL